MSLNSKDHLPWYLEPTDKCEKCGKPTEGGYCDCMIVDGVFKGDWWNRKKKDSQTQK